MNTIARTPDIDTALNAGAVISYSVSGGKDSDALVLACERELRGHAGPRVLIHADLGRTEWQESLPQCQRLAEHVGLELIVVRRKAGGMMERWLSRWESSVRRYAELSTVTLILPWSTPSMRFCTSELKTAVICRELAQRFAGKVILNALGIRAEESANRAQAPISKVQPLLYRRTQPAVVTTGYTWLPIHHWSIGDVWDIHEWNSFDPHPAYTEYGMSRVSCVFCILANKSDLEHAAAQAQNLGIFREMCQLEIDSTFAFQSSGWLSDVAPHQLTPEQREAVIVAKKRAERREKAERRIPRHLLYDGKGWPKVMPTRAEAQMLAEVRCEVAAAVGIEIGYTSADQVYGRYSELMERKPQSTPVLVQEGLWAA